MTSSKSALMVSTSRPGKKQNTKWPSWLSDALKIFKPPERLTVSEWADKHRILDVTSAELGPWRIIRTLYLQGIMDAFTDPDIEEIIFVKSTQVGGTETLNYVPCPHCGHRQTFRFKQIKWPNTAKAKKTKTIYSYYDFLNSFPYGRRILQLNIIANYDREHDILYVSVGKPVPSYSEEERLRGVLIRRAMDNNRIMYMVKSRGDSQGNLGETRGKIMGKKLSEQKIPVWPEISSNFGPIGIRMSLT